MTTPTEVVKLPRTQAGEAGQVLGRAFQDDPYWSWVLPDECKRARALPWFMTVWAKCCHRYGANYTTVDKVEGAAVWIPPGKYPTGFVTMLLSGMIFVPLKFGLAASVRLASSTDYMDRLHKRDVPPRHWYLATLGVDPPRQGQGVGSALIQPALALADAEGVPCYLETETADNVRFYESHGFEVVVEGDLPGDGSHYWTMMRQPNG